MGTINLNKDEMLKEANELSALKEGIRYILNKTHETEKVLIREELVTPDVQIRKLRDLQDFAYNLVREFDKISDNFYQAAKACESTEDKINNLVNINKDCNLANIIPVNSVSNTYLNNSSTKKEEKSETVLDKLQDLTEDGWSFIKGYLKLYISAIDFMKDVCDNINTFIDGYLKDNEEFIAEFNEEYPELSILFKPVEGLMGISDGALKFAKDMTFGLGSDILGMLSYEYHGLLENPEETLSENLKALNMIRAIMCPMTKEEQELQSQALSGIWQDIKTSINENIINGNPYTAGRFVSDVGLNIASLFFGAGELKAAGSVKKADNVLDGVRVIDKVSDVSRVEKSVAITAKVEKKIGNALADIIHTRFDSLFEYVKQTKDLGSEISLELRNKIFGVREVKIPKSKLTQAETTATLIGCFTGDTLVLTESGLKEIKYINEGDFVYSKNEEDGQVSLKKVLYTYIKEAKDFIKLKFRNSKIECTPNHLFMLEDGAWITAEHLGAGYRIVNSDGSVAVVEGIEFVRYNEGKAIYNLNVEDNHTYFVSEDKVCVHNDCMVTAEGIERVFNAIPEGTPKDISWNDFQALMKGQGNTAEKAAAYSKFSNKSLKKITNINEDYISITLNSSKETDIISKRVEGFDLTPKEKPYKIAGSKYMSELNAKVKNRTITKEEWKLFDWNKRFANRRNSAIDRFWEQERQRILKKNEVTRNWSTEQVQDILNGDIPKYEGKAIAGHHTYSASKYPHLADKGEIIYPATFNEHLNKWHGRNFKNSYPGAPINPGYPDDF